MTRRELIEAIGQRYRGAPHPDKPAILDEFVNVTGYHRKHAIRLLQKAERSKSEERRSPTRIYNEAIREALILLWEAADRICGKRLKPLLPVLIEAMERHEYLQLDTEIRNRLLAISAATIDRLLSKVRESACGDRRKSGVATTLRRSIPVRTFADWNDLAPGYLEADLVAHCGGSMEGSFLHSFVLTDIATGWTECLVLHRFSNEQTPTLLPSRDHEGVIACDGFSSNANRSSCTRSELDHRSPRPGARPASVSAPGLRHG